MRKLFLFTLVCILSLPLFAYVQQAGSQKSNRGAASTAINGKTISIDYGQPQLRGRDVMTLAAPGTVWRMGMDNATELHTAAALKFKGLTVNPGKYTLFAKKISAREWDLIVNKKTGIWGTDYDASQDLGSTPFRLTELKTPVETFTISLSSHGTEGLMEMSWGTLKLSATFTAQ